ncbi:MAG TPA: fibronectin type III domain-containing protein [Steroidobacteraceae bacterium]|nr:fibronectin type III domain-containing protein [Steroidobacteraceae bacterium]
MGPLKTLCGLVVAVLVLSGCGGGGSSSVASVADSPPGAPASSGSTSSPPTTPPPSSGGSSPPPSGGGSAPPPPPATGSAKLTWTAPTTNSDGSAITGLAGYHIHYGTTAASLTNTVDITNPATLTYVVANLQAGTWYFAVTAYTNTGIESSQSNVGKKTIT